MTLPFYPACCRHLNPKKCNHTTATTHYILPVMLNLGPVSISCVHRQTFRCLLIHQAYLAIPSCCTTVKYLSTSFLLSKSQYRLRFIMTTSSNTKNNDQILSSKESPISKQSTNLHALYMIYVLTNDSLDRCSRGAQVACQITSRAS